MRKLMLRNLFLLLMVFSTSALFCSDQSMSRGGIAYSLSEPTVVYIDSQPYLNFDITAAATSRDDELGTGIILLSYNPASFGENIFVNNNVLVTKGDLLVTAPNPLYDLIVNDYDEDCLAVTFEYTSINGSGNTLTTNPQQLLNVKVKILSFGQLAGLGLFLSLMQEQQYEDDNVTLLNPVTAAEANYGYIAARPVNLVINRVNGNLTLSWDEIPGFSYNVYSAEYPVMDNWQLTASGLSQPWWVIAEPDIHRFYYVTSRMNSERREP